MFDLLRKIIFEYAVWIIFVPCGIALWKRKRLPKELRAIGIYLLVALVTQVASFSLYLAQKNNLPLLHLYTLLEYLVLLGYFWILLRDFLPRPLFVWLAILLPAFSITESLVIGSLYTFNSYTLSLKALIFIFLLVAWFLKVVSQDEPGSGYQAINYINSGFLVYFSGAILLFSFSNSINSFTRQFFMNIWSLHTLLLIILYILISIGLWKAVRAR